jgi:hypothetical protein
LGKHFDAVLNTQFTLQFRQEFRICEADLDCEEWVANFEEIWIWKRSPSRELVLIDEKKSEMCDSFKGRYATNRIDEIVESSLCESEIVGERSSAMKIGIWNEISLIFNVKSLV